MKEWIYKDGSGEYVLTTDPEVANLAADAVEVPCGAEIICWFEGDKDSFFYKSNDHIFNDGEWSYVGHGWKFKDLISGNAGKLLWQREKPQEKCADICGDDIVSHPSHYCSHPSGIECIEITRHHDFAIGNAIKYLWRAGLKDSDNEVQDLKKAVWYIQDKIKQLEKKVVDDKTIDWVDEVNSARSKD